MAWPPVSQHADILSKRRRFLDQIMTDEQSNPRHKIEAIKELRATAAIGGSDRPAQIENFITRIDLTAGGGDVNYDKTITINTRTKTAT